MTADSSAISAWRNGEGQLDPGFQTANASIPEFPAESSINAIQLLLATSALFLAAAPTGCAAKASFSFCNRPGPLRALNKNNETAVSTQLILEPATPVHDHAQ